MKFLETIRQKSFWVLDLLKGGQVRKHYTDIKFMNEQANSEKVSLKRKKYLADLLNHAVSTVPIYSNLIGFKSLSNFPVINKSIIRENIVSYFSTSFKIKKLHKVTTSGSTGAPFTVYQDKTKRIRHTAENIYISDIIGYSLGSRLYYLRVWNEINRMSSFKAWKQNIIMLDTNNLSDKNLHRLITKLRENKSKKSILAFASTLEALSKFIKKQGVQSLNIKVEVIITMSESLPEGSREVLMKAFGCPVISRYSNMENGFLAQQYAVNNIEYHLNQASFYFELLHPYKDEIVKPGEIGRIIVTDLFNYAMPLIRYDTGDMAVISENSTRGVPGPVFTKIEGRRVDFIFDTKGNLLSPHVITNTMWKYANIVKQFQLIQEERSLYLVKLNLENKERKQIGEIVKDLKLHLGNDAEIQLKFVDDIPVLASGKRKKIINNYVNDETNI